MCSTCPPSESFSQRSSTSSCVSQLTRNDIAGENLKIGPPFNAMNRCLITEWDEESIEEMEQTNDYNIQ
jgi:hypothetical protein